MTQGSVVKVPNKINASIAEFPLLTGSRESRVVKICKASTARRDFATWRFYNVGCSKCLSRRPPREDEHGWNNMRFKTSSSGLAFGSMSPVGGEDASTTTGGDASQGCRCTRLIFRRKNSRTLVTASSPMPLMAHASAIDAPSRTLQMLSETAENHNSKSEFM